MKKTDFSPWLLALSAFVFCCLLLTGAQRLIAAPEQPPAEEPIRLRTAALCAPVPSSQEAEGPVSRIPTPAERQIQLLGSVPKPPISVPKSGSDANGNVLIGSRSYLHMVYQAFALGDGFV